VSDDGILLNIFNSQ